MNEAAKPGHLFKACLNHKHTKSVRESQSRAQKAHNALKVIGSVKLDWGRK
jgi:hypothetical protein